MSANPDPNDDDYYLRLTKLLFPHFPTPEQFTQFYEAVGAALSSWQAVEQALYLIFERAIEPGRPGSAGCGFHVMQFRTKLDVTDAAVRFALLSAPKREQAALNVEWRKLYDKARDKSTQRNHFAHFQARTWSHEKSVAKRIRLAPAAFDFRYAAGLINRKEYTVHQIRSNAEAFRLLAGRLSRFIVKVPPQKKRL